MSANAQSSRAFGQQMIASFGDAMRRLFSRERSGTIIVGSDARMRLLAMELAAAGKKVTFIKLNDGVRSEINASSEWKVVYADALDDKALAHARAKWASSLVTATTDDPLNMNLCRAGRDRFGIPLVVARLRVLNWVTSWAKFNSSGMVEIKWPDAARSILGDVTPHANTLRVVNAGGREQVAEVEVRSPIFIGRTIADLSISGCDAIALTRGDLPVKGFEREEIQTGDVVTLIGSQEAIDRARETFTSL